MLREIIGEVGALTPTRVNAPFGAAERIDDIRPVDLVDDAGALVVDRDKYFLISIGESEYILK